MPTHEHTRREFSTFTLAIIIKGQQKKERKSSAAKAERALPDQQLPVPPFAFPCFPLNQFRIELRAQGHTAHGKRRLGACQPFTCMQNEAAMPLKIDGSHVECQAARRKSIKHK